MAGLHPLLARGLAATIAALGVLALGAGSAAAANPVARAACTGPASLGCVPCPLEAAGCPDPTGQVAVRTPVSFTGDYSTDSDGEVENWKWTFQDGSTINGSNSEVLHQFASPGTYSVVLEVTDDDGQRGSDTMAIVVGPRLVTTQSAGFVLGSGSLTAGATVNGRVEPAASATLDFRLYGPDDALCAGMPVFSDLAVPYPQAGGAVTSRPFTPTLAGAYRWSVTYGNDPNNTPTPSGCGAAVLVSAPPPPPVILPAQTLPGQTQTQTQTQTENPSSSLPAGPACFGKAATIVVTAGELAIKGTPGADVIVGSDSGETIDGRGGNDIICSRGGIDIVRGSAGNDRVYGGRGADLLLGGTGADTLFGQIGKDRLGGGPGADRSDGGSGNDLLDDQKLGGEGKDRLVGGSGADNVRAADQTADSVDCGTGRDTASLDRGDRQALCDSIRRAAKPRLG